MLELARFRPSGVRVAARPEREFNPVSFSLGLVLHTL